MSPDEDRSARRRSSLPPPSRFDRPALPVSDSASKPAQNASFPLPTPEIQRDNRDVTLPPEHLDPTLEATSRNDILPPRIPLVVESSDKGVGPISLDTMPNAGPDANGQRLSRPVRIRRPTKVDDKRLSTLDTVGDVQHTPAEDTRYNPDSSRIEERRQPSSLLERLSMGDRPERLPASWDRDGGDDGQMRADGGDVDESGGRKGGRRGSGRTKPRRQRTQKS